MGAFGSGRKKKNLEAKNLADESDKTKRARGKLMKKSEEIETQITEQALKAKSNQIQHRISSNQDYRVPVKKKQFGLFDENQHSAKPSKKVLSFAAALKSKLTK